ncbi:hypothetical protein GQ53DRAFT_107426 [Thozetella sp. PMI_491]|nr:hypothetical protein GQ53DRAFT_107426 [Thozetella sp. PMI_491]
MCRLKCPRSQALGEVCSGLSRGRRSLAEGPGWRKVAAVPQLNPRTLQRLVMESAFGLLPVEVAQTPPFRRRKEKRSNVETATGRVFGSDLVRESGSLPSRSFSVCPRACTHLLAWFLLHSYSRTRARTSSLAHAVKCGGPGMVIKEKTGCRKRGREAVRNETFQRKGQP